ncbi:MAG: glycosyltransferase family 39 protein, partial [Chromatiaceae bacterium]|nr:glycosyltransferase family 39 protein [Chromatiaceae bacterium]
AILLDDGLGFFRSFFLEHNAGRFTGVMHGHSGFPGYYLVMLPIILLPFSGWFLTLLPGLRRAWTDPLERFLWLWFLSVFVFFSFSGTQLPHYLLYGCTPLFILLARHRAALTSSWLAFGPLLGFLLLLLALPALLPLASAQADRLHEVAQLELARALLGWSWLLGVLAALGALLALWRWSGPPLWQRLLLAGVVQVVVVYGLVVPAVFAVMQEPVKEAALLARSLDRPTLVYRTSMPSFSVYREAITPHRAPQAGDLVFLRRDKLERLREDYPGLAARPLYERGAVALVEMEPAGDG